MEQRNSFTQEELAIAKSVDLTDVARNLGYTVKKVGSYFTLKEIDSLRIYNRRSWFRWSKEYDKGENGGSQIDFLRVFAGMEVKEAVFWLLDFDGYRRYEDWKPKAAIVEAKVVEEKVPFVLPVAAPDNHYLYQYLMYDRNGNTLFASMRGVFDRNGKCFKCDVAGNDKNYGFNVWNEESTEIEVFEGAIDLMSYADIYSDFHSLDNIVIL